jgi:hypothetical protein
MSFILQRKKRSFKAEVQSNTVTSKPEKKGKKKNENKKTKPGSDFERINPILI